jgi:hypothetical protein
VVKFTDVSEMFPASIIRARAIILKMKASTSETSVNFYQTTRCSMAKKRSSSYSPPSEPEVSAIRLEELVKRLAQHQATRQSFDSNNPSTSCTNLFGKNPQASWHPFAQLQTALGPFRPNRATLWGRHVTAAGCCKAIDAHVFVSISADRQPARHTWGRLETAGQGHWLDVPVVHVLHTDKW